MQYPVTGLHHITACASGAQEDIDFFTRVVGQRMIKQTILFDGRYAHYHFYYANANAEPGTVMTTFPYKRVQGRPGAGQVQSTVYTVRERVAAVLGGSSEPASRGASRHPRAFRAEVRPLRAPFRTADRGDRRRGRAPRGLEHGGDRARRIRPRIPRPAALGARNRGRGAVLRRGAGLPQDRRRWRRITAWRPARAARARPSSCCMSRRGRPEAGSSARARIIMWR